MKHFLPNLPYAQHALAPIMSEETLAFHHGKHLQTYVDNLNRLIRETEYEQMSLDELVKKTSGPIFNNAAQVWNHRFFFESLSPEPQAMSDAFKKKLENAFGSVEKFKEQFLTAAASLFGSGWVWLVLNERCELQIISESNAGNPLREGHTPLLTIDVWEHAYYIDYRNRRADYLEAVWTLIDWQQVFLRFEDTTCNIYI